MQSGHGSSCRTLLTPTKPHRRGSTLRAFIVRACACTCTCVRVWRSHHLPRRGMSGRTECGEPSVTIAHRGIFTPTLALSRNPSIPILHTSRRLITVTSPAYFLPLRQCRGIPERVRDFTRCGLLLVARKVVRMLREEREFARKKVKLLPIVTNLYRLFTIATVYYEAYFDEFSLKNT